MRAANEVAEMNTLRRTHVVTGSTTRAFVVIYGGKIVAHIPRVDEIDEKTGKRLFSSTIIPNRGAWIEYETDVGDSEIAKNIFESLGFKLVGKTDDNEFLYYELEL